MRFSLPFDIEIDTTAPKPGSECAVYLQPGSGLSMEVGIHASDAIESYLLALAAKGIDLSQPEFSEALTTAAESIVNHS